MVLVLPEMFFPPGSSDPREVADVLCIACSPDGRFTHCMRSEEGLCREQEYNTFMLGHSYLTQQKPSIQALTSLATSESLFVTRC